MKIKITIKDWDQPEDQKLELSLTDTKDKIMLSIERVEKSEVEGLITIDARELLDAVYKMIGMKEN